MSGPFFDIQISLQKNGKLSEEKTKDNFLCEIAAGMLRVIDSPMPFRGKKIVRSFYLTIESRQNSKAYKLLDNL